MSGQMIQINTDELKRISDAMHDDIRRIDNAVSRIKSIAGSTDNYWTGEGAEQFKEYFKSIEPDLDIVVKRLYEHPKDYNTIISNYTGVENTAVGISEMLDSNVIT